MLYAVNQKDYVIGIAGDPKNGKPCYSYFTCGTPLVVRGRRRAAEGQARLRQGEAAGEGSRLQGREDRHHRRRPTSRSCTRSRCSRSSILKKLGINAEIQAGDWGTLITRRAVKEPIDKGGWNIFHTWLVGPDMVNPAVNFPIRGTGEKAWFGWPTDAKMEELREAWFNANDAGGVEEGGRRGAAARVRVRAVHPDRRSSSCRRRTARTSPA